MSPSTRTARVYVGGYTASQSLEEARGIHIYDLSLDSGALRPAGAAGGAVNPSYLAAGPDGRRLYAVNEVMAFAGQPGGGVSAYAVDTQSGDLSLLNAQPNGGDGPCHLAIDRSGRWLLTANYAGGSVSVLPIAPDGQLGPVATVVKHHGTGFDPARQDAPHAHSVTMAPDGRYALVCDLGLDKIMLYRFDPATGALAPHTTPAIPARPGAGPRFLAFNPNGRCFYCANELNSTVAVYRYDPDGGDFAELQVLSTLPAGYSGQSTVAHVLLDRSGEHLYVSNRGHDSLAIFSVAPDSGLLTLAAHVPAEGRTPRQFTIDPSGRYLLAANQDSGTVAAFRIEPAGGGLSFLGNTPVAAPACILITGPSDSAEGK